METETRTRSIFRNARAALTGFAIVGVLAGVTASALQTQVADRTDSGPSYVQVLEQAHHCWTGEAPASMAGKLPGGVIVQHGTTAPLYVHTPAAVGAALDHVFKGTHPHLTVVAFCR